MFSKKYIIVIVKKEQNTYSFMKKVRVQPSTKKVTFKSQILNLDLTNSTFDKGLKKYYFYEFNSRKLLLFNQKVTKDSDDTQIINDFVTKNIFRQLISDLNDTGFKEKILFMIIGATLGGLIGYLVGSGAFI